MPIRHPLNLFEIEIFTERLCLTPSTEKWLEDCFREFTPEVSHFMASAPLTSVKEMREQLDLIQQAMREGVNLGFDILSRDKTEFLGRGGIDALFSRTPRMGLWFKKSVQRQGLGSEFVRAMKVWADDNLDADYLLYRTDRANTPSLKLAQKLNGKLIGQQELVSNSGELLHVMEYRIELSGDHDGPRT